MTPEQIAALAAAAAQTDDQTAEGGGGYTRELPAEGSTVGRLIEYIEIGARKQKPFKGKAKPNCREVRLTFELLTNSAKRTDVKTIEVDGQPVEIADQIRVKIPIKKGDRSSYTKLLKKMIYGREGIVHMAQMLGQAFLLKIVHNKPEGSDTTYANIRTAGESGEWQVSAPRFQKDPMDDESWVDLKVRDAVSPLRIFIYDHPTKESWDSLFIDGTRTVKNEDGTESEVSKNWIQESIVQAEDFHGSALEAFLAGIGGLSIAGDNEPSLDDDNGKEFDDLPTDNGGVQESASEDDLASLGL